VPPDPLSQYCTAFAGFYRIAAGPLLDVALALKARAGNAGQDNVLIFDDATGRVIDLDLRGTRTEIADRLTERLAGRADAPQEAAGATRGRGRPKLGVVAREVTLLPRHWDWLAAQPGGASQALRRLIDEARRADGGRTGRRAAQEAAYRFITVLAGNLPGYEEALRALFAGDAERFARHTATWPADIQAYARQLAQHQATVR
jgi:uncharacterized protein